MVSQLAALWAVGSRVAACRAAVATLGAPVVSAADWSQALGR